MRRIATLIIAGTEHTTEFPADWEDKDRNERIEWLTSWAGNAITNTVIDRDL